jgi:hypothetical protein
MAVHTDRFFQRRHRRNDSARRTVRSGGNVNAPPLGRIKITEDMCEHAIQAIYLHADALRNTKFKL